MRAELIKNLDSSYEEYLSDESKMTGNASTISFPETREEVVEIVNLMRDASVSITVQGGKTGICGAAVPHGGHVMNLSNMKRVESLRKTKDGYTVKVQTGLLLCELNLMLSAKLFDTTGWDETSLLAYEDFRNDDAYFWPPDPTETSAAIGGMLGTNAQSITDFRYGRIKEYVNEIEMVDAFGNLFSTDDKDLYLGSEGMYGIFISAELRLIKKPAEQWGICFFFEEQLKLLHFAEQVLKIPREGSASVAAVELIDRTALNYIRKMKQVSSKLAEIPDVDEKYSGMIYVELHGNNGEEIERLMERLIEVSLSYGIDEHSTWALFGETGIEKLKLFRHSAPESVNAEIKKRSLKDPRITKLSTDMTTCNSLTEDVFRYQKDAYAQGLEIVIFGHVPENRIHVNIISDSYEDYIKGKKLIESWYVRALQSGGTVFREHGIGKVKKELFLNVMGTDVRERIAADKKKFDPLNLFNPGNKV